MPEWWVPTETLLTCSGIISETGGCNSASTTLPPNTIIINWETLDAAEIYQENWTGSNDKVPDNAGQCPGLSCFISITLSLQAPHHTSRYDQSTLKKCFYLDAVQLVNQSRLVISEHTLVNMISKPLDGRKMLALSMIHILCGFICIIIETVKVSSTFNQHTMATYGEGFYCGAIFLFTGIFDLVKKQEKMTFEKTSFGLKILSAVAGGWIFTISGEYSVLKIWISVINLFFRWCFSWNFDS